LRRASTSGGQIAKCKAPGGRGARPPGSAPRPDGIGDAVSRVMLDLVFVAVTIGFFVLGVAYTRACDRL
jgi:hypothetical protein